MLKEKRRKPIHKFNIQGQGKARLPEGMLYTFQGYLYNHKTQDTSQTGRSRTTTQTMCNGLSRKHVTRKLSPDLAADLEWPLTLEELARGHETIETASGPWTFP
ncbi:Hypothetical predicted protein [Pelobates cultripes]|uniref:Uncharacterized protein n=1 Tax=Pelobates cultripes TaxID=61616 RepID=A0AAD1VIX7_PELCU|nr:Hypothetical predicted protein [Pelobates cultripes]